ncbi:MAG: HAD family hydrolase [Acidimicrobiales bacterium]
MPDQPRDDRAVLFDIDGTLVDSNYLHVAAWQEAFDACEHHVAAARIHRCIGMDSEALLAELLGPNLRLRIGDKAKKKHSEGYKRMAKSLRAFPQARELVARAARDARVVLATSAPEDELATLRRVLDVEDHVDVVTSAADVDQAKPAPDLVEVALARAGVEPGRAQFVGDTVWDIGAAGRAGVACLAVLTGGISEAELLAAGAVAVYQDPAALLFAWDTSPLAAPQR